LLLIVIHTKIYNYIVYTFRDKIVLQIMKEKLFLNPSKELTGKNNFKIDYRIDVDGKTIEQIRLDCDSKEKREEIILYHFLSHLGNNKNYLFEIEDRDNPWDFFIIKDKKEGFFVEITSFSENESSFIKKKQEEKHDRLKKQDKIRLGDLRKIAQEFGFGEKVELCLKENEKLGNNTLVENPLEKEPMIFISLTNTNDEKMSFLELIQLAIQSKLNKSIETHSQKESVFLVLDNRTIKYDKEDYEYAVHELTRSSKDWPFLGVFIYTGFYSDDDGKNSEFFLTKIK